MRGGERQAEVQEQVTGLQEKVTELQAEVTAGERREREGGSGGQAGTLARAKEQFAARLTVCRARFDHLLGGQLGEGGEAAEERLLKTELGVFIDAGEVGEGGGREGGGQEGCAGEEGRGGGCQGAGHGEGG